MNRNKSTLRELEKKLGVRCTLMFWATVGPIYCLFLTWPSPPGGYSHMEWTGILVVSLRGVNFGFWSRLGCLGKMPLFLAVKVSLRVPREEVTERILVLYVYSIHTNKLFPYH